jgi:hypothetical protein
MMAGAWCLPKSLTSAFLKAIQDGTLAPEKLMSMTSAERRAEFAKILGDDNAREVNAQFEARMLLKDQKAGLVSWAKKIGGLTEPARRDIISTINKLDRVLNPAEEKAFLEDLAAKKLGVTVTSDEAKEIFQLSQKAEAIRNEITQGGARTYEEGYTREAAIRYGNAQQDLVDKVESLKPPAARNAAYWAGEISTIPQTLLTGVGHMSAPVVQGWGSIATKPWRDGIREMFRYFGDEQAWRDLNAEIITHPKYAAMKDSGLKLSKLGDTLSQREEAIQSHLVEDAYQWAVDRFSKDDPRARAWYLGNLIRASSRGFTGYLNYLRFHNFLDIEQAARMSGEDVGIGTEKLRSIGQMVNDFSGAGSSINYGAGTIEVPKNALTFLNTFIWSTRKLLGTMEMVNPLRLANPNVSQAAKLAAIKQLSGSLLATAATLSLAKAMGASVDINPTSPHFLEIQFGRTYFDVTGGNSAYWRLVSRLIEQKTTTAAGRAIQLGQGYKAPTSGSLIQDFVRGKLTPVAGTIADAAYGPLYGGPFSVPKEAEWLATPILMDGYLKLYNNDPENTAAWAMSLTTLLGVSMRPPDPPPERNGRDFFGDKVPLFSTPASWRHDPVVNAVENLGLKLSPPPDKINGIPLTDSQYDDYARLSGRLAHARLEQVMAMPKWQAISPDGQRSTIESVIRSMRDQAQKTIKIQSMGSDNDIARKATEAKRARPALTEPVQ